MADIDLIIRNGSVVDGGGGEPYEADILITGDRIAAIEPKSARRGKQEIDAANS